MRKDARKGQNELLFTRRNRNVQACIDRIGFFISRPSLEDYQDDELRYLFFLLLNSVYTALPLSQGLDIGLKGENTYENSQVCTYKIVLKCLYRVLLTFSYPL